VTRLTEDGIAMTTKKLPYVEVLVNGKVEIWPYPEAQEFTIYKFPKESIMYLTDEEYKKRKKN